MPRFVVLHHEMPPGYPRQTHFDLMIEREGVLWTWACDHLPAVGEAVPAERLADHRLAYLEYEGPLTGDRGNVSRVAEGHYILLSETADELRFRLVGETLQGDLALTREAAAGSRWTISLSPG